MISPRASDFIWCFWFVVLYVFLYCKGFFIAVYAILSYNFPRHLSSWCSYVPRVFVSALGMCLCCVARLWKKQDDALYLDVALSSSVRHQTFDSTWRLRSTHIIYVYFRFIFCSKTCFPPLFVGHMLDHTVFFIQYIRNHTFYIYLQYSFFPKQPPAQRFELFQASQQSPIPFPLSLFVSASISHSTTFYPVRLSSSFPTS